MDSAFYKLALLAEARSKKGGEVWSLRNTLSLQRANRQLHSHGIQ
jgi:hypothetical protein